MGQKVNPNGFRYGISKAHNSQWFAEKANFGSFLVEDAKIYKFFDKLVRQYQIGKVEVKRNANNKVTVLVHTAKPAAMLGAEGKNIQDLTLALSKFIKNKNLNLNVQVLELKNPDLNAKLLAEMIATKLENRESFRSAQKIAIRNAMRAGAKGIKTAVSGRLNGVDMARTEGYSEGEMKLHTLRQDVDYATATARTTYGAIGVKVWVSLGEKLEGDK
ncbi:MULTISPECIES: 30S ribosomal protein S3 [unclassified Mycoplasma]|uniref:30S ribosomal protein S3 n=1 Tax=unclassified Mycoplasma TaxID=2683645 RepID=UPI002B1DC04B|nr:MULTISPECIES: 30S ribosomal protein S3 [unclassified Mycoplasma]MEA4134556.1 30S ribosomal protein S3 [Mycoplasma sp. 2704]MEA4162779.1 30S ribosomal protein S3 [Mycoplasma sp. 4404]MEA4190943.1 30S ribosomal protein S3 [Mycoplasma sp. 2248]MEA4206351.1 30S ribosomal protein S3 [Mycoplasma sp. 1199]MEA4276510.1 30S ribosomal protein S3 [Mycoplasma sp. 21DD0573]